MKYIFTTPEARFSSLLAATTVHAQHGNGTAANASFARTHGAELLIAVRPRMFQSVKREQGA
ncbi:hypothetical protein [Deinococcus peraridilitoris]|uniref:hypothetical protein n=1 Tax=Deinococcus peraridilitoris TaxID=432329 RepID=UPI0002D458E2|nr:hypothetical protein [Deinococcus peraridilitoris]